MKQKIQLTVITGDLDLKKSFNLVNQIQTSIEKFKGVNRVSFSSLGAYNPLKDDEIVVINIKNQK